jgi:hypothetical protein
MSYPQQGAKYRNEPAWLDRMKKAEGGSCNTPFEQRDDGGSVTEKDAPMSQREAAEASGQMQQAMEPQLSGLQQLLNQPMGTSKKDED